MLKLAHRHHGGDGGPDIRKDLFIPSATAFQDKRRASGGSSPPSASSSFGSHSTDVSSTSRDDSDSDCTCDVESSSNFEDSGLFSCDGEVESIIAPPSPFVTRSHVNALRQKAKTSVTESGSSSTLNNPLSGAVISSTLYNNAQAGKRIAHPQCAKSKDQLSGEQCGVTGVVGGVPDADSISPDGKPFHSTTIYVNGAPVQQRLVSSDGRNKKFKKDQNNSNLLIEKEGIEKMKADVMVPQRTLQGAQEKKTTKANNDQDKKQRAPISYPAVTHPICKSCLRKEATFFDPSCNSCWAIFQREDASPSHVFAVLRLWVPQIQKCVAKLVKLALELGCGIHDRDAVTDMTLVHYAVKSGSTGIGNPATAYQVVNELLSMGADLHQRCKWTSMTALHYAAYFDVPKVLDLILQCPDGVSKDDPCLEYNNGTPLHIAAANLSEGAVRVLLTNGASASCRDNLGRLPIECIPSCEQYELVPDLQELVFRLQDLLDPERLPGHNIPTCNEEGKAKGIWGKAILKAIGLKIGDRILISGVKTGILRYAGPTEFATGLWAGVELETPQGRHNGTVKGVFYFRCSKNYGIFVPVNRLTKIPNVSGPPSYLGRERQRTRMRFEAEVRRESRENSVVGGRRSLSLPPGKVNHGRVDISKISSKVAEDIRNSERKLVVDDRVWIDMGFDSDGNPLAMGVVRFTGPVHFASGYWIGIELDEARGSHDGSVCGTRYFTCRRHYGIFAAPSRIIKIEADDPSLSLRAIRHRRRSLTRTHQRHSSSSRHRDSTSPHRHSSSVKLGSSLTDSFSSSSSTSSSSPLMIGEDSYVPLVLPGIGHSMQSLKTSFYPTNTSMSNLNKCFSGRYIRSRQFQEEIEQRREEKMKEPRWEEPLVVPDFIVNMKTPKENPHWLEVGHSVFYRNKVGTVKYIGHVHFADGIWLGLDLRERRGKNNGMVKGRRYFNCKAGHGVMVPPNKVTVHGLNGELLVKYEELETKDYSYEDISV